VYAFLFGKVPEVVRSKKPSHDTLRTVAVADQLRDHLQAFVQVPIYLLAGVVHVGEVTAGYESDLVAVSLAIRNHQFPQFPVVAALILKREPAESPGDARPRPTLFNCFPEKPGLFRTVNVRFVFAVRNVSGCFNLVDANDGCKSEETIPEQFKTRML